MSNVPASSVLATSAEIGAIVTDTGGLDPTLTLYWGASDGGTNPANWDSSITLGEVGVGTYRETITGLTSDTEYFYRAFAQNDAGSSWASLSTSFTTAGLSLPALVTQPAADVGAFSATVAGVVTDTGGDPPTVTIYYGTADGGTNAGNAWEKSARSWRASGQLFRWIVRVDAGNGVFLSRSSHECCWLDLVSGDAKFHDGRYAVGRHQRIHGPKQFDADDADAHLDRCCIQRRERYAGLDRVDQLVRK